MRKEVVRINNIVFAPSLIKDESYYISQASTLPIPQIGINNIPTFTSFVMPKDRISQIRKVKEYRHVDIIDRLLRIKVDYGIKIKRIECSNNRQKKFYEDNVLPLIKDLAMKWEKEHNSIGDTFIHFAYMPDERTPMFLLIEDAEYIDIIQAFGIEQYKVKLSPSTKNQLKELKKRGLIEKLPPYLQEYLNTNMNKDLVLTQEQMYRTSNMKSDYEVYSYPPLMTIAEAIELRKLLTDTDFVTAYGIKSEITQFKIGNKERPASKERIMEFKKTVEEQPPGLYKLYTPWDVEIKRIGPDPTIWNSEKYNECNNRILEWGGISRTLISGQGTGYSTAVVSTKSLQQSIATDQEIFNKFIQHYFDDIDRRNGFRTKVKLVYERNALRDHKEFMDEVKFLTQQGVYGIQDLFIIFDLDEGEQIKKKEWDKEYSELFVPAFEPNQGLLTKDAGRPKTTNSIRDTSNPRPNQ